MEATEITTKQRINRMDFFVLKLMIARKCTNDINSITATEINNEIETISYQTVRNCLKKLKSVGFVDEGIPVSQAKGYYITQNGVEFIKERVGTI